MRAHPLGLVAFLLASSISAHSAEAGAESSIRRLQEQNDALQRQLEKQQALIDVLTRKVSSLEKAVENRSAPAAAAASTASHHDHDDDNSPAASAAGFSLGKLRISGEGAAGFFDSQANGQFPHDEFRVDEAKLFLETPLWDDTYFFAEINLFTRESTAGDLRTGELYLDFENLSRIWKRDGQLNFRVGRLDIPFGEEYLTRDAIDNPLISHSVFDLWGVDEGVELYGALGKVHYVAALQNGSHNSEHDFDGDKSVAVRLGADPTPWLHLSASAMRTGDLNVAKDGVSELWLGPGLISSLGSPSTTSFHANLLEGDVQFKFARTTLKAAGGLLHYDDNDPISNNRRDVYYYSVEAWQKLYRKLYAAARWSQVLAHDGFPVAGNGNADTFVWSGALTKDLWLLSVGFGYRWSDHLVVKAEYSFEQGRLLNGQPRLHENLVAINAAFGF